MAHIEMILIAIYLKRGNATAAASETSYKITII